MLSTLKSKLYHITNLLPVTVDELFSPWNVDQWFKNITWSHVFLCLWLFCSVLVGLKIPFM